MLDISTGWKYIKKYTSEKHDKHMIDTINMYAAHGIDIAKNDKYFAAYLKEKRNQRFDEAEKFFKDKNRQMKTDKDIDDIITKKQKKAKA